MLEASLAPPLLSRAFSWKNDGSWISALTLALTIALELWCLPAVLELSARRPWLYAQAVALNLLNNCLLGPLAYEFVQRFLSPPLPPLQRAISTCLVLLGHAVGYYAAHRLMHTRAMYWIHTFHHKFRMVIPSAANAVSLAE
jgi:sterol desaturase/sphingolipid hydroxylase (fatty acid hydroxylase superfamily)